MVVAHLRGDGFRKVEKWQDIQDQFVGCVAVAVINCFSRAVDVLPPSVLLISGRSLPGNR